MLLYDDDNMNTTFAFVNIPLKYRLYSQSRRSVPYNFEDYLKIDFHDWMNIQTQVYCLPPLFSSFSLGTFGFWCGDCLYVRFWFV